MKNKFKDISPYLNVLFIVLVIFTFVKLVYFTIMINAEISDPIKGSEFQFNKLILSYLFSAFSIYSIALIFNGKKSYYILLAINILLTLFMFINLLYYRSFESYLSIYNISQYKNFGVVSSSAFALLKFKDILLFIDPIILIMTRSYWKTKANNQKELDTRQRVIISIIPLFCFGLIINYKSFFTSTITKIQTGAKLSIVGHHYYDLSSYVSDSRNALKKDDVDSSINKWYKIKNQNQGTVKYKGKFKDKNLIVVQVESLENFVINLKVNNQEITPTLNKLLNNSYYFNNIKAQENGGNSSDADFMINTSLLPLKSGSVSYRFANNKYNSLPVILRNIGYNSHSIHSGEGYFWNKENFIPNLGFDSYTDISGMKQRKEDMFFMGLNDKAHLKQVADKVNTLNDKHYLFTVTETSHTPFELNDDMKYLKLSDSMNESEFGKYFQAIRYTDEAIKEFMQQLEKDKQLDNTIVVFYGDHEGIHKYNNDTQLEKDNPDYLKYSNDNEIPLIIYSKDLKGNETITKTGGQIDIMPTILALLGIEDDVYQNTAMGNNLFNSKKGYAINRNGRIYGVFENEVEYKNIKSSINVSEKIIRSNYFEEYYIKSKDFKFNGK